MLGDRPIQPLTAQQAMQMLEAGILPEDNRLELLHGMLTEKAVKRPEHCALKSRLLQWLWRPGQHQVRVEGVLRVADETSLPEPVSRWSRTSNTRTNTLQPLAVDVEPLDLAALFDGLR